MIKKLIEDSSYAHKQIRDNFANSAEARWLAKEVKEYKILYDGSSFDNVELRNSNQDHLASMSLSERHKIHENSLLLVANPKIENIKPRPSFSVKINFDNLDLSKYNRIRAKIYIESSGFQNFYFHFGFGNADSITNHAPSLSPNIMNDIVWEVSRINRDAVSYITIAPFLMGCPPEAEDYLKVYICDVRAELVDSEYELGWSLEDRIAFCHSGYFLDSEKIALGQNLISKSFELVNLNNQVKYTGEVIEERTNFGVYNILDFSRFCILGTYKIKVDNKFTDEFIIDENPYISSIWKSLNFLRMLRCGEDVSGVHSPCHLNCKSYDDDGRSVPNFGGWHDAGDVSQFEICTAEMAHAIIDLLNRFKDKDKILHERLLEEAKVGILWLLRTRFGDGKRALAVTYSIWRDNVLKKDNATVLTNQAENGPFENFCAAGALAESYLAFKDIDDTFALWCLRAGKEDFEFGKIGYENGVYTKRWGPSIPVQTSGAGALAASILYKITKDDYYLKIANNYSETILACQEQDYQKWDKPIRGFFYEDPKHEYILSYDHRGHEQTPIQALSSLCELAKEHHNHKNWLNSLYLYKEYIERTIEFTLPYGLISANIYILDKVNLDHLTIPASIPVEKARVDLEAQIRTGVKLGEGVYLRAFPIAIQRRGFHATLLSKTKAISYIAKVLDDKGLKQIAINQLQWILGMNPFASSTMYGEGYNYHPLYVAFSPQIVGALPVGIRTYKELDEPYWPVINNAVYKEIWGHTTGKFLWVLADLL